MTQRNNESTAKPLSTSELPTVTSHMTVASSSRERISVVKASSNTALMHGPVNDNEGEWQLEWQLVYSSRQT